MIKNKVDYQYYISEDQRVAGYPYYHSLSGYFLNFLFPDYNLQFILCLRHLEWHLNRTGGGIFRKLKVLWYTHRLARLRARTGIELSPNCAGPGLHLPHGKIVVNSTAKIGANCKIMSDVTIGAQGSYGNSGAPVIGSRVYIGTGARIIGCISVADDVVIGANAVVTKDITEPNTTWGGIPARKISNHGSEAYLRIKKNNL